jgi:hypothetical protein
MIPFGNEVIRYDGVEYMRKFNPYHDPHNGQFTTAEGAGQADDDDDSNADVDSEDDSDTDDSAVGSDVANAIADGMNGTSRLGSDTQSQNAIEHASERAMAESSWDECLDRCYAVLERFQEPGSDRNKFDFHACMNECLGQ